MSTGEYEFIDSLIVFLPLPPVLDGVKFARGD
jgi:hypothetical protein